MSFYEPKKRLAEEFGDYGDTPGKVKWRAGMAIADYNDRAVELRRALVKEAMEAIRAATAATGGRLSFKIPELYLKDIKARWDEDDVPEAERPGRIAPGGKDYMETLREIVDGTFDATDYRGSDSLETRILTDYGEVIACVEYVEYRDGTAVVGLRDIRSVSGRTFELHPMELVDPKAVLHFIEDNL